MTTPAFLKYPHGEGFLEHVAKMGGDVTGVIAGVPTVFSLEKLALVDEVGIELPIGNRDFLAIGVMCGTTEKKNGYIRPDVYYWGTVCITKLLLESQQADLHCLVIRRSQCELRSSMQFLEIQNVPRVIPVTLAAVYDPVVDAPMASVLPLTPINLDTCRRLMVQRMRQYKSPDDGCLLITDADRRCDRLSYILAAAAVAQGTAKFFSRGAKDAWLKGEMGITRYRLRAAHVPQLLHDWRDGGIGVLDALELLPHALSPRAAVSKGRIVADLPLWGRIVLHNQELLHKANLTGSHPDFGDHAVVFGHMFREFYHVINEANVKIKNTHASVLRPKRKHIGKLTLEDGTPLLQVDGLGDLKRVMPGCMRILFDRGTLPHVQPHLKFNDRNVFYPFVLANGIDPDELEEAVMLKFENDAAYDTRKLRMAVKSTKSYVNGPKFGAGHSCKRLMNEGYCPFFSCGSGDAGMSRARVDCHSNQMQLVRLVRPEINSDPDGIKWSIGFPLIFAQKVKFLIEQQPIAAAESK